MVHKESDNCKYGKTSDGNNCESKLPNLESCTKLLEKAADLSKKVDPIWKLLFTYLSQIVPNSLGPGLQGTCIETVCKPYQY